MTMSYISTRGRAPECGFEEVLLTGLAPDGGLYVPRVWPALAGGFGELGGADYPEVAARVLAPFAEGCFDLDELRGLAREAYGRFAHAAVAPLAQLGPEAWMLELFHGPTLAFKDYAMQLLGLMFERVLERRGETVTIVGATSGDTGAAAIKAFAGLPRARVVILHPRNRVSEVQRRQMTTEPSPNVTNIAIQGSFDDCQNLIKAMFADERFRAGQNLAAVNSINWARIACQAVYYVWSAVKLGGLERPLAFAVPTGNFGNVFAGYVAWRMGLPVRRLVIGTNVNDILARFFASGRYEAESVQPTWSPSMDIQISSNFERLLFDALGRDGAEVERLMQRFRQGGGFGIDDGALAEMRRLFSAVRIDEAATLECMRELEAAGAGIVDPHSAVGYAAGRVALVDDPGPWVSLATAHPAKFPQAVTEALGLEPALPPHLADLYAREERLEVLPAELEAVQRAIREARP